MLVSAAEMAVGRYTISAKGHQVEFMNSNVVFTPSLFQWQQHTAAADTLCSHNILHSATTNSIDLFAWSGSTYANWGISALTEDLLFGGEFVDWGVNFPMNTGDSEPFGVLTSDEWDYLLTQRYNASALNGRTSIDGLVGWVILADSSTQTIQTSYTTAEWNNLAAQGAIFLPMAGKRLGGQSVDPTAGLYWTSTAIDAKNAKAVRFTATDAIATTSIPRSYGGAVRLARRLNLIVYIETSACEQFTGWSDGNTDNPRTFRPGDDTDVEPVITQRDFIITTSKIGNGSVSIIINQPN